MKKLILIILLFSASTVWAYHEWNWEMGINPENLDQFMNSPDFGQIKVDDIYLDPISSSTATKGYMFLDSDDSILKYYNGSSWISLTAGTGDNTLDNAYDQGGAGSGKKIEADSGAVEIEVDDNSNNAALLIDQDDSTNNTNGIEITNAGTGNAVDIEGQSGGYDIYGTGDNWYVSGAGAGTFAGLTSTTGAFSSTLTASLGLTLDSGETITNTTNTEIKLSDDSEDLIFDMDSGTNAIGLKSSTGVDELALGAVDDLTGIGSLTFDQAASTIGLAANGDADDLTLQVTGAHDSSLVLSSAGTGADAMSLATSAGGMDITVAGAAAAEDLDITTNTSLNLTATEDAASAIYLRTNGGTSETMKLHVDQGNGDAALDVDVDAGGIDIDAAKSINIDSDESEADSISINSDGGIDIIAAGAGSGEDIDIQTDASVNVTATEDDAGAIYIQENGGTTGAIKIHANQGTSTTEGSASIQLTSDDGGINLLSGIDGIGALQLVADGGTSETVFIQSDQGTAASAATESDASVQLKSDVGGIGLLSGLDGSDSIRIEANGGTSEEINILANQGNGADSIELKSDAGGITLDASSGVTFTQGQTRKVIFNPAEVELDGTNPPGTTSVGTDGQAVFDALNFDATGATGDDKCFINWMVPDGYKTDSASLNVYWSYSDAEDAADDIEIDGTVNAVDEGEALDAAGTAMTAVAATMSGDTDNDKLIKTSLDIEVEDIAVGDMVCILFYVDESASELSNSGTADVHYFEIEYESTE